jgi:diguanylate cyclase (GGDEF)-like protein
MNDAPFAIDLNTMLIVMFTSAVLMASVLWFACAGRFRDGLGRWTTSLWAQALAWLVLATSRLLPELLAVPLANGLLALSCTLQAAAISEFRGRRTPATIFWAVPLAVSFIFAVVVNSPFAHEALRHLAYGAANAFLALSLLRSSSPPMLRPRALLAGCYAIAAVTMLFAAWIAPGGFDTANAHHGLLYLGTYTLIVCGSAAFLLMHKARADEEASRLATTDPLTGVFNRRTFIELADQELARSRRSGTPLSLMILDLDHFKRVNDTYGHLAGDQVLIAFTQLIKDCVRRGDLVVRYGGEEFCVLLPGSTLAASTALAERIRTACAANALTERSFKVTVSIGVTAYAGDTGTTLADLLARADEALYLAKDEGRNRVIALPLSAIPATPQRVLPLEQVG